MADLPTSTETQKQPKHPSIDECMNNLRFLQMMGYYVRIKERDLSSHQNKGFVKWTKSI